MSRSIKFTYREVFDIQRFHRHLMIILHKEGIYINDAIVQLAGDQHHLLINISINYD